MHAAVLTQHPTDPNTLILNTPPDLKAVMGRFEAARYSTQHKGYLFHVNHLDSMLWFLQLNGIAVMDDRPTSTTSPPSYRRGQDPVLKCQNCGYTQREDSCNLDDCRNCGRCHGCKSDRLRPHVITLGEQIDINRRGVELVRAARAGRNMVKGIPND